MGLRVGRKRGGAGELLSLGVQQQGCIRGLDSTANGHPFAESKSLISKSTSLFSEVSFVSEKLHPLRFNKW